MSGNMKGLTIALGLSFILIALAKEEVHKVRIKSVQCKTSGKTLLANYSCFAKAYSRKITTITTELHFNQKLDPIFVSLV